MRIRLINTEFVVVTMHIPDGYLDPIWCAGTYAVTIAYLIYTYRRVRANYDVSRAIPLMTVFAAGIFVAQMLNVGGSRGIFLGAFLGGWAGITIAGAAAGTEIGLSPWFPYGIYISLPVMASWHALLGIVEGAITAFVAQYLLTKHPELTQVVKVGVRAS